MTRLRTIRRCDICLMQLWRTLDGQPHGFVLDKSRCYAANMIMRNEFCGPVSKSNGAGLDSDTSSVQRYSWLRSRCGEATTTQHSGFILIPTLPYSPAITYT